MIASITNRLSPAPLLKYEPEAISISLSASVDQSSPCWNEYRVTISATPTDKVYVELLDPARGWLLVPQGLQGAVSSAYDRLRVVDNKYTHKQNPDASLTFRARPKEGYTGETAYVIVTPENDLTGAPIMMDGVHGFSLTYTDANNQEAQKATLNLIPGGVNVSPVHKISWEQYRVRARLLLWDHNPGFAVDTSDASKYQVGSAPQIVTPYKLLSASSGSPYLFTGEFTLPKRLAQVYGMPEVRYLSDVCLISTANRAVTPTVLYNGATYPMVLRGELDD